ncbi:hypothetical protein LINGRAHAP2_LOCUS26322 [Linum grandiflorum]
MVLRLCEDLCFW